MTDGNRYRNPPEPGRSGSPGGIPDDQADPELEDAPRPASYSSRGNQPSTRPSSYQVHGASLDEVIPELQRYLKEAAPSPARQPPTSRNEVPPGGSRSRSQSPAPSTSASSPRSFEEDSWDTQTLDPYDTGYQSAAVPGRRTPVSKQRSARSRTTKMTPGVSVAVPEVGDHLAVGAVLASLLGLLFMVVTLASQIGGIDDNLIPFRVDASGDTSLWATPETLWRIPFGVFMMILMSALLAYFLARRDQYAARIVAFSTVMVQIIAWIALIDHLS